MSTQETDNPAGLMNEQGLDVERLRLAMREWYGHQGDGDHPRVWVDEDVAGIAALYAALAAAGPGLDTKTITADDLTRAMADYFIAANMGMPGPRQERMAADIWFRLGEIARLREEGEG